MENSQSPEPSVYRKKLVTVGFLLFFIATTCCGTLTLGQPDANSLRFCSQRIDPVTVSVPSTGFKKTIEYDVNECNFGPITHATVKTTGYTGYDFRVDLPNGQKILCVDSMLNCTLRSTP